MKASLVDLPRSGGDKVGTVSTATDLGDRGPVPVCTTHCEDVSIGPYDGDGDQECVSFQYWHTPCMQVLQILKKGEVGWGSVNVVVQENGGRRGWFQLSGFLTTEVVD